MFRNAAGLEETEKPHGDNSLILYRELPAGLYLALKHFIITKEVFNHIKEDKFLKESLPASLLFNL